MLWENTMKQKLPPHNQRRLNVAIAARFDGKYRDCIEYFQQLQQHGFTDQEI